ncbi:MAG: protoporphyrinogen oxidase [Pirellulales bacterium]|nr:protoporphyrinogen oxidase [Pirellulales bacterium]
MSEHPRTTPPRIAVIGGGISGLAAAHRLRRLLPRAELRVFELGERLGGPLHTLRSGDSLLEQGADSFLIKTPWALDLCRDLGLADQLIPTNEQHRRALVVRNGKLLPVPDGFVLMRPQNLPAMLRSPVLSVAGKLRLMAEPLVRAPAAVQDPDYDESVASFAARRLGRETYERLVQPLVAGIFVADAKRLSLGATFPEFLAAEREFGSLWRSVRARKNKSKAEDSGVAGTAKPPLGRELGAERQAAARYGQFVTLRGGLSALVAALRKSLCEDVVQLRTRVDGVSRSGPRRFHVASAKHSESALFDGVILATSTSRSSAMLGELDFELAERLSRIEYASSAVVTLVYRRDRIAHSLDGFGVVVPVIESSPMIAASFLNVKFPHTVPADLAVIRVFCGGVLRPELVHRDDAWLIEMATLELADLIGARGKPLETHVARWVNSMPQYEVGHLKLVAEIESRVATHDGLQLAGSGYRGVGIPQCVQSGQAAAERLAMQLADKAGGRSTC